jgi:4'-phosphopantetheinyl transferase
MNTLPAHLALGRVSELARQAESQGLDWLSAAERQRYESFKSPARKTQFVSGRWLARQTLVQLHGGDLQQWGLSAAEAGPPLIDRYAVPRRETIYLGISHSADHVACVAGAVVLGLDIEASVRKRDIQAMAGIICTPAERLRISAINSFDASDLHTLWTLKEAWIKRHADSLSLERMARIQTRQQAVGERANARVWHCGALTVAVVGQLDGMHVSGLPQECAVHQNWCVEETPPVQ